MMDKYKIKRKRATIFYTKPYIQNVTWESCCGGGAAALRNSKSMYKNVEGEW